MTKKHKSSYRVYYEDTDAGGIMYHGNFINFCERARSDMLREIGYPASEVTERMGTAFVVRHLDAEYLKMAKLDDLLEVETSLTMMKNSSFTMKQVIHLNDNERQNSVVFSMHVTLVCIDLKGKPVRVPDVLRAPFKDYLEES